MGHSKSRLVEDADESAPVRLETAPTGERKCLFIFRIHHSYAGKNSVKLYTPTPGANQPQ